MHRRRRRPGAAGAAGQQITSNGTPISAGNRVQPRAGAVAAASGSTLEIAEPVAQG